MESVIMASPDHYRVSYAINLLTNKESVVDHPKAVEQFNRLKARFAKHNIPVHVIDAKIADPSGRYPDFVYVSNSALILRGWPTKVAILARYAHPERRGEEERVGAYLKSILGYKVISLPERDGLYFEGQGDTRWSDNGQHLWMCYGTDRTTKSGIQAVKEAIYKEAALVGWVPPKIHSLQMVQKKTYHLDLCFLPLPNGRALLHGTSLSAASRKEVDNHFGKENVVSLPLKYLYACNSVWLNDTTVLIPRLPGSRQWMYKATQMHVEEVNVDEFHLAGGSVSCMVLPVWKTV
jgi:N-dimethylarginine dimethylaminohydrolase